MLPISDTRSSGRFPFWTVLIIIANIVVFLMEVLAPDTELFIRQYALVPRTVRLTDPVTFLPFFTSMFLHGGIVHILSNMWFLQIFGDNVEDRLGRLFFPVFYLLAGFIGGLGQFLIDPSSTIPVLGASGAIAGVMGAYMAFFPHHTIKTLVPYLGYFTVINLPAFAVLLLWFATQLFNGSASLVAASSGGGVAFFAHVGGFVTGWTIAKAMGGSVSGNDFA